MKPHVHYLLQLPTTQRLRVPGIYFQIFAARHPILHILHHHVHHHVMYIYIPRLLFSTWVAGAGHCCLQCLRTSYMYILMYVNVKHVEGLSPLEVYTYTQTWNKIWDLFFLKKKKKKKSCDAHCNCTATATATYL